MNHLEEVSVKELRDALDNVEENKPIQRLLVSVAYKNDITQTEPTEWHHTDRRTIYSRLNRPDTDELLERVKNILRKLV